MSEIKPKRWTLRICKYCRRAHLRYHDGCVTYSNSMFPQMTEWAGVDEVEVMPVTEHEAAMAALRKDALADLEANGKRQSHWLGRALSAEAELARRRAIEQAARGFCDAYNATDARVGLIDAAFKNLRRAIEQAAQEFGPTTPETTRAKPPSEESP